MLPKEPLDIHGSQGTKTQQAALSVHRVLNKYLLSAHIHERHCQLSAKGSKILKELSIICRLLPSILFFGESERCGKCSLVFTSRAGGIGSPMILQPFEQDDTEKPLWVSLLLRFRSGLGAELQGP